MDQIVIILVHYNTEKETDECLASLSELKASSEFETKVLIVDNGSLETYRLKKKLQRKNFEVIRSEKNIGFTGGNNLGIWYAKEHYQPTYFVLLNSDTTVAPDFLHQLYREAKNQARLSIISPKIYFSPGREYQSNYDKTQKGRVLWYAGGSVDWRHLTAFHRGVDEVDRGQFDMVEETEFCTGCCLFIPAEIINQVGALDKRYFLYFEDVDFSLKVQEAGYGLKFCPASVVWHKNAGSTGGSGSNLHQYYQNRNRLLFTMMHGPARSRITALKLAWRFLKSSSIQRKAVLDLLLGKLGKQSII